MDDLWADQQLGLANGLVDQLQSDDPEKRKQCYAQCRKEYSSTRALCKDTSGAFGHDVEALEACKEYARKRYQDCLNPFSAAKCDR